MILRMLHTSDWHLGASLENASRFDEQERFLDWLLETLTVEQIDVLLLAGDVFHFAQPSTDAQRLYYRFLSKVGAQTPVRHVVVIGGNHDSPSRLDAPREVLEVLNIRVVGGLPSRGADRDLLLYPLFGQGAERAIVQAVIVAVPFVHEFRLGVRTTDQSASELKTTLLQAFTALYQELADQAAEEYPHVPLIATGHLACTGGKEDYLSDIHQVGSIGVLNPSIFDPRFSYVALGHYHRHLEVGSSRVRYSGTPLPMNEQEARSERFVLKVELELPFPPDASDQAPPHPTAAALGEVSPVTVLPIPVPHFRDIYSLSGSLEEVEARLYSLSSPAPLPPFVYVRLLVDQFEPEAESRLHQVLEAIPLEKRPRMVHLRQEKRSTGDVLSEGIPLEKSLADLTPEEVFVRLHLEQRDAPPPDPLLRAFRDVCSLIERDELNDYLAAINGEDTDATPRPSERET